MATAQKTKTLPVVIPTTCQKSQMLIKHAVALAVSNVAYNRGFFPEDCFIEQEFEGLRIKVLKTNTKRQDALAFQKWISSAMEAFDKGYLKQLIVCLSPDSDDTDIVLESYKFTFNNKNDGVQMVTENLSGSSIRVDMTKVKEDYVNLIRSATNLPVPEPCDLYESVRLCVKLTYNQEVTPMDYEPEGFHKAEHPHNKYILETLNEDQGKLNTGWHSLKLSTKTVKDPMNAVICENGTVNASNNMMNEMTMGSEKIAETAAFSPGIFSQPVQIPEAVIPETVPARGTIMPAENTAIQLESPDYPVTPMDYEPEGFHKAEHPQNKYILETLNEDQGKLNTGWRSLKLSTKTVKDPMNAVICENGTVSDPNNMKHQTTMGSEKIAESAVFSPEIFSQLTQIPDAVIPDTVPAAGTIMLAENTDIPLESPDYPVSAVSKSITQTPSEIRNCIVDCVCKTDEESHGIILSCSLCGRWQHGACYRVILEENVPSRFCCFFCNDKETGNMCYDQTLHRMDEERRKEVCMFRKALAYCSTTRRLNMKTFASDLSLSDSQFEKTLKLLEADNVLAVNRRGVRSHVRTVNNDHLTNVVIPKLFHDVEGGCCE